MGNRCIHNHSYGECNITKNGDYTEIWNKYYCVNVNRKTHELGRTIIDPIRCKYNEKNVSVSHKIYFDYLERDHDGSYVFNVTFEDTTGLAHTHKFKYHDHQFVYMDEEMSLYKGEIEPYFHIMKEIYNDYIDDSQRRARKRINMAEGAMIGFMIGGLSVPS